MKILSIFKDLCKVFIINQKGLYKTLINILIHFSHVYVVF